MSFLRMQESLFNAGFEIPAFAGMTKMLIFQKFLIIIFKELPPVYYSGGNFHVINLITPKLPSTSK
jgi:hypothetical protein